MKYKLLVTDMDGTLLKDDGSLSNGNKKAIKKLLESGGHIALASGRVWTNMTDMVKIAGVESERHIANNGINIFDMKGNVETLHYLEQSEINRILDFLNDNGIENNVFNKEMIVHNNHYKLLKQMAKYNGDFPTVVASPYEAKGVFLIYGLIESEEKKQAMLSLASDKTTAYTGDGFCIFAPQGSGKYDGAMILAKEYGISEDEMICIGDSGNDVDMLEKCKFSIAVKNAEKQAKDAAKEIVDRTNEEDAVAYVIEKYML